MSASSSIQITMPICITQDLFYCVACLIQADGGVFKPQLKFSKNDAEEKYVVLPPQNLAYAKPLCVYQPDHLAICIHIYLCICAYRYIYFIQL